MLEQYFVLPLLDHDNHRNLRHMKLQGKQQKLQLLQPSTIFFS